MNKKRVGVLTFHNYDNYGAILQSYALQKKIRELGAYPEIIDYRCDYISNPFRLVNLRKKGLFNYIYGAIGHICYLPRRRACNRFRQHMRYSEAVTREDMSAVSGKYDIYIAGSDQIWDHKLTNFDKTYFLDFVKEGKKKYSYAASIGEHLPPEEFRADYSALLKDFDQILVREEYGADVVEELAGTRPATVCDPTLLLTADEWEKLLVSPHTRQKYILVYQLGINKKLVDFVRRLKNKTGYKVIYIPFPLIGLLPCSCRIAIGPDKWMGLFKNAEYVVSDSFHGIVYALLFNRKFFALVDGHHMNRRVQELLKLVGLSHRTIENVSDEELTQEIDFTSANKEIDHFRQRSLAQLKSLLD